MAASAGDDTPQNYQGLAEMSTDSFDVYKDDTQAMLNDYSNQEIVEELKIKGF